MDLILLFILEVYTKDAILYVPYSIPKQLHKHNYMFNKTCHAMRGATSDLQNPRQTPYQYTTLTHENSVTFKIPNFTDSIILCIIKIVVP